MQITLYNTTSPANAVTKTLTNASVKSGDMVNSNYDLMNPVVRLNGNVGGYNYAEINGRYYYIRTTNRTMSGYTDLTLHEDVLMTHKAFILNQNAIIRGTANHNNLFIADSKYRNTVKETTEVLTFPNGLNTTGEYILITAGG